MKFHYIGTLKNTNELHTSYVVMKKIKREEAKIAIIDDETFPIMDTLKYHKFDIDKYNDVESIDQLSTYDIILCDIQGVGTKFSETYQGAYLVKEIYKKFPFKIIIAYTGSNFEPGYNNYLKYAEFNISKDASSEEWVGKLDLAIDMASDPEKRWNRIKNYLLGEGVSLFELALLEDDFVRKVLDRKDIKDFPKYKLVENLKTDFKEILKSFAVDVLTKIIIP